MAMRRSLVLIMSLACALALVSCGGKGGKKAGSAVTEDGKVDLEKVADKMIKEAFEGDKYSKEAAEYYFKKNEGIKF